MSIRPFDPDMAFPDRFLDAMSSPVNALEGSLWGIFLVSDGSKLYSAVEERIKHCWIKNERIEEENKKLFFSSFSFMGTLANFLSWANQVAIISLGDFAKTVSGVGYFSRMLTSGSICLDSLQIIKNPGNSAPQQEYARQMRTLSMIKLAAHVSMVAWAVLGLFSLVVVVPELIAVLDTLFFLYCVFSIWELFYRLPKNQKLPQPAAL